MSVLLLGFSSGASPEESDTQFLVTGVDAWRIIALVEPFESRRKNPRVFVTIYSEDLTEENANDNLHSARDVSIDRGWTQSELPF